VCFIDRLAEPRWTGYAHTVFLAPQGAATGFIQSVSNVVGQAARQRIGVVDLILIQRQSH
jgi:hypothetical protein